MQNLYFCQISRLQKSKMVHHIAKRLKYAAFVVFVSTQKFCNLSRSEAFQAYIIHKTRLWFTFHMCGCATFLKGPLHIPCLHNVAKFTFVQHFFEKIDRIFYTPVYCSTVMYMHNFHSNYLIKS